MIPVLKDAQVSMRLPNDLKDQIEAYARMTGRSKSHVAVEALADYLSWRMPQIEDLKAAVDAADRGEFASEAEVEAAFAKHTSRKPATKTGKAALRGRRA
jgi:RHH-type transcriptional regulator, rel operon repressor / antitoxin RelB